MAQRVYIETTVISYLTAWRSPKLLMAAHQEATRKWWDEERHKFELFVSEAVILEASGGDPIAAADRLAALQGVPELQITDEARALAKDLIEQGHMPEKARVDALHIATATVNGMDYLITWNCRHIANATIQSTLALVCDDAGYTIPVICTPLELFEVEDDD